jgi:sugar O-acyltransferase (sialic acid O-acetyltransferase NeuD family)
LADAIRAHGGPLLGMVDRDASKLGTVVAPGGTRVVAEESVLLRALDDGSGLPCGATALAFGIGDNAARLRAFHAATRRLASAVTPAVAHPSAVVAEGAVIGPAAFIGARAVVNPAAEIGPAAIVNTAAVVEHDCRLGEGTHVSPAAVLAGGVSVGPRAWIGAGAVVVPGIRIGADAIVGAGAVVIRDVPEGATVVGNPARLVRHKES